MKWSRASMTPLRTCCAPSRWAHPRGGVGPGPAPEDSSVLTARFCPQLGLEVSPSTLFAVASILEGCAFLNGSPQNTLVPGALELAWQRRVFVGGDDFKSGQTKVKSVLVDFLIGSGLKVCGPGGLLSSVWGRRGPRGVGLCAAGPAAAAGLLAPADHVHRELQPPGQQRRAEPVGAATVPLQGGVEDQRGGRHGAQQPSALLAGRRARPLRAWGAGVARGRGGVGWGRLVLPTEKGRDPCDLVPPPRWSSSTCHTWVTASVPWMSTHRS